MATNFVQEGHSLTWTNGTGSAVSAGDVVVVGAQIGIAAVDIADSAAGTVYMSGVYTVPKVSGAVIAQGEMVAWDASASAFDDSAMTPATGDITGACTAWEGAGDGVTSIAVKLNTGVGTVN
ncbi:MAG: DUF2190 family protein [Alphaproteobacteria bacterium]|jgi:predicted RecA/RadA family phage recombinase|nr:DUF2190 family protein [Alphaproteobacteria bacterium]